MENATPLLCVLVLALAPVPPSPPSSTADTFSGKVVGIIDGDTITVLRDGHTQVRVRLEGIDSPELGQDFGQKAKEFTSTLAHGRKAEVEGKRVDQWGRLVARVIVDGRDLSVKLVRAGLAWHFTRESSDPLLATEEEQARAARRGLWATPNPVPPWDWRQAHASP